MKKSAFLSLIFSAVILLNMAVYSAPSASPAPSDAPKSQSTALPKSSEQPKASASPKASKGKTAQKDNDSEKKSTFPVPHAKSAIVIDANSGDVIYALNADDKAYPAGTSNIMTALIALENGNLGDICTVTAEALAGVTYDQPQMGLKEGETYTVEQLLYSILVNSNNDAANALAISVAGSIDDFVKKMNEKAVELGLSGTHFANPSGKHDENHYTTAADLAKLSQYAMKNSSFMQIASTQKYVFPATNKRSSEKTILSTNHLISRYKYPYHFYANATGIKSGNSKEAGYCLAASAVKGKLTVISVVMGCENTNVKEGAYSFVDTAKIFDYVFENYQSVLLAKKGDVIYDSKVKEAKNSTRLALTVDEDVYTTLKRTADPALIKNKVKITEKIKAPIVQGDYFGTITYYYNDRELTVASVVAANEVKRDFILHIINSIFGFIFNPIVLIIIILIAALLIKIRIEQNKRRRIRHSRMVSKRGANSQNSSNHTRNGANRYDRYPRRKK